MSIADMWQSKTSQFCQNFSGLSFMASSSACSVTPNQYWSLSLLLGTLGLRRDQLACSLKSTRSLPYAIHSGQGALGLSCSDSIKLDWAAICGAHTIRSFLLVYSFWAPETSWNSPCRKDMKKLSTFLLRGDDAVAPSSTTEVYHCFLHCICLCPDIQDFFFLASLISVQLPIFTWSLIQPEI